MIDFNCQGCGHFMSMDEKFAGRTGKCPKCQNPMAVPASPSRLVDTLELLANSSSDETPQKVPSSKTNRQPIGILHAWTDSAANLRSSSRALGLVHKICGVIGLIAFGVLFVSAHKTKKPEEGMEMLVLLLVSSLICIFLGEFIQSLGATIASMLEMNIEKEKNDSLYKI